MKNLKSREEFLNESAVAAKDWDRMLDLVMKGDDGSTAAKLIKDKGKAIARFVAGLKLSNSPLNWSGRYYSGSFRDLGDRAIEMGATPDEIKTVFDSTDTPVSYVDKMAKLGGKKLNNRFVGQISKAILGLGYDIVYLPHNGYALTHEGKDAMSRNGRKWTIGYKTEILFNSKKANFNFDAITDEGDGPTSYIVDRSSDKMFSSLQMSTCGIHDFLSGIKNILEKNK